MKTLRPIVGRLVPAALGLLSSGVLAASTPTPRQTVAPSNVGDAAAHTPLHLAALRGDADAVDALLANGADPNATNRFGATPLHYGVGSERIVAALLARAARVDVVSKAGATPLFSAVSRPGASAVVRRLIAAGADVNFVRPDIGTQRGGPVLAAAVLGGDRRTLALLLNSDTKLDPQHFGPGLGAAALTGDLETARELIDRGADLNSIGSNAGAALNTALRGGHREIARLLIEHGADLTTKSPRGYGTTPLLFSAYHDDGDVSMTKLLLDRGADLGATNDLGETVLGFALKNGADSDLVRFLTARGATSPKTERNRAVPARDVPAEGEARAALLRESAQRAVDLLQRSSTAFLTSDFVRNQGRCISCHQQSLPAMAYGLARERGLRVDELEIGRQLVAKSTQRSGQVGRALELIMPTGGATLAFGHDAEELTALGWKSDEVTEAMSHYLLAVQAEEGSWSAPIRRVPMGDGPVIATAWSLRAVQLYPPAGRSTEAEGAVRRAREWLWRQKPATLNERTFQLLGLAWANETRERLQPLAKALAREQRTDGGWAQLPGLTSDAWATGSVLHALHKAGIETAESTYQRGVDFLLRTQFPDGSWRVRTRAWPFQPHFDSGFPHGRDQWISAAATAWATTALLFTLDPTVPAARLTDARQMMAAFLKSQASPKQTAAAHTMATSPGTITTAPIVDFARDIQPVLQRSCADCHGGARPKAGFTVATREALLKGGQNGEPAIVPGHADQSHLLRYVSDQVEDLEMPPLDRREKYPSLSAEEIKRLRAWIDAGAPWSETKGGTD